MDISDLGKRAKTALGDEAQAQESRVGTLIMEFGPQVAGLLCVALLIGFALGRYFPQQ